MVSENGEKESRIETNGTVLLYGDSDMPDFLRENNEVGDIENDEKKFKTALNYANEIHDTLTEAPFDYPLRLVVKEFQAWTIPGNLWAKAMRDSNTVEGAPVLNAVHEWLPSDEYLMIDGERTKVREEEGKYASMTTAGASHMHTLTEEAMCERGRKLVIMRDDDFVDNFVKGTFKKAHSRGKVYRAYDDTPTGELQEMMGIDVDENEATANQIDVSDGLGDAEDVLGHAEPFDQSEDREELNQTSGSLSTYVVKDNPGAGQGSATFTTTDLNE